MTGPAGTGFDWRSWRREVRRTLIEARRRLADADRRGRDGAIDALLREGFGAIGGAVVAFCWPIAGEPEPRHAVRRWREAGSRAALPVVVRRDAPLAFREWWPGAPMARGVYDIPYPVDTDTVVPEAVVVPVNGFDPGGHRLGYGAGLFDRTLAAMDPAPIAIGLGYETARLRTIHPQPHDVPFDFLVTEAGIGARIDGNLEPLEPAEADARVRALQTGRGIG